jgi:hypothetical protein
MGKHEALGAGLSSKAMTELQRANGINVFRTLERGWTLGHV